MYGGAPGPVGESFAVSAGRLLFPVLGRAEVRRARDNDTLMLFVWTSI